MEENNNVLKYVLIFIATIIGAFLAFYFVADITLKTMLSPDYHMRRAEKMMRQMDRQFDRDLNNNIMVISKSIKNPVEIEENDTGYKVTISLKSFSNNSKNIKIDVDDDNILKIEGSNEVKKGDRENLMNISQSYFLNRKIDKNKITREEHHGKYIVTIPFKTDK